MVYLRCIRVEFVDIYNMRDTLLAFTFGCMILLTFNSCQSSMNNLEHPEISEDSLLNLTQYRTFQYFLSVPEIKMALDELGFNY